VVKWAPVFVLFIVMALLTPEEVYQRPADGEGIEVVEVRRSLLWLLRPRW